MVFGLIDGLEVTEKGLSGALNAALDLSCLLQANRIELVLDHMLEVVPTDLVTRGAYELPKELSCEWELKLHLASGMLHLKSSSFAEAVIV